jgi:hypothetical protein
VSPSPGGVMLSIYIRSYPDGWSKRALIITVHKGLHYHSTGE